MKHILLLALPLLAVGCASSSAPLRQSTQAYADGESAPASATGTAVAIGATSDEVKATLGEPTHIRAKASGRFLRTTWTYENHGTPGQVLHINFTGDQVQSVRQEAMPAPAPQS